MGEGGEGGGGGREKRGESEGRGGRGGGGEGGLVEWKGEWWLEIKIVCMKWNKNEYYEMKGNERKRKTIKRNEII